MSHSRSISTEAILGGTLVGEDGKHYPLLPGPACLNWHLVDRMSVHHLEAVLLQLEPEDVVVSHVVLISVILTGTNENGVEVSNTSLVQIAMV